MITSDSSGNQLVGSPSTSQHASNFPPSPSASKFPKKFQRLRVRSLSRTRGPPKVKDATEILAHLASPIPRRRNNSAGNLYAVDPTAGTDGFGSFSHTPRSTLAFLQDAQRNTLRHLSKSWESLTRVSCSRLSRLSE